MTTGTGPEFEGARRGTDWALAAALAMILACVPPAAADEPGGTWSLQLENDRIANTDRHYTHGSRLSWVSDRKTDGPAWVRRLLETIYPLADVRAGRIGFALGHNIYTPENTDARVLVVNDRPYAGWLYGAVSLHAETSRRLGALKVDTLDSVELNLGIVGPQAYAADVQNIVHDFIGVSRSNGWDNQLENEPALAIFFERKWRPEAVRHGAYEVDIIPHIGGSVGNVFTLANAGGTLRFGQGLNLDFGPPHIRPTLSGLEAVGTDNRFGWYLFAGAEARAVLHNIFLDGNTVASSHSVSKKNFVGDFQLGAAVIFRGIRVAFTHVLRTREYDGQPGGDRYGTVSVSAKF
jgi:lipid A 3-O-deacylase